MNADAMRGSMSTACAASAVSVRGENLRMSYCKRTVLDVPGIEVAPGQTYAIVGASGAGKSTLLRVLGLLERPSAGRVLIDGREASGRDLAMRRSIAAVFQKPYLLRGTVVANVAYGLKLRGVGRAERETRAAEALATVGLGGWEGRSALTLSGGEAQRVALARALVLRPSILLLDEPLSYLDPLLKRELTAEFARILSSEHVTAIYVTHDQDEASVVADRMAVMREGRIVSEGTPDEVLGLPTDEWVASFVGMQAPLQGVVRSSSDGLSTIDVGGTHIEVAQPLDPGAHALAAVRPEDVTIFSAGSPLPPGSARNHLPAEVVEMRPQGGTIFLVLRSGGATFAATISRASAEELAVAVGVPVTAAFKATAVRARQLD